MTTIHTSTTLGITLTPASYTNPVVIAAGVTIASGAVGMYGPAGSFVIENNGTIAGADGGVVLNDGGSITNVSGGGIVATTAIHSAVHIGGAAGLVVNAGSIIGDGASGVALNDGGGITNQAGGTIGSGGTHTAVYGTGAPVGLVNAGMIGGINLLSGGTVINQTTGTIERGGLGVYIAGAAGTVINAGTIAGTGSGSTDAVLLPAGYANLVVVDPGASFTGLVSGGNMPGSSIASTLELASAASAGSLSGLGIQFVGFGATVIDAGAKWSIAGDSSGLAGAISGFAAGDTIEVTGFTATGTSVNGRILTLDNTGGGTATLDLPGTFSLASLIFAPNADGTEVTLAAPCFCAGTRLLTVSGEVAVEALQVGELLVAPAGGAAATLRPVVWIGHCALDCRRHRRPHDIQPVRVTAGAFGDGLPARDLRLSPDHSVYCGGVLIPIRYLVNGATIVQEHLDEVAYWHVELARHAVILAEGLPCESYLDTGNRGAFGNGGPAVQMHPDFALRVWEAKACAPLVRDGARLEAVRGQLLERAGLLGFATTPDPALRVVAGGHVVRPEITGQAHRFRVPANACGVRLVSRGAIPAEVHADGRDHRRLGVAVSRIALDGRPIALTDPRLSSGWHEVEHDGAKSAWRWTDGNAGLALAGVCLLEVEVAMTERYWVGREDGNVAIPATTG